jgi:AcrR family transcriptional regulator
MIQGMGAVPSSVEPAAVDSLRERKKRRTRKLIAETAQRLFVARGFEAVTIAEVAAAAEVAEKTIFNYFPTKEDLVYWKLETFEEELLAAIGDRKPGESALDGFAAFLRRPRGLLAEGVEVSDALIGVVRMIAASPHLLAREQTVFARYTESLASLLARETGAEADDVAPQIAAHAMIGAHRALVAHSRPRLLAGTPVPALRREVRTQTEAAIQALAEGFGGYAVKPG